MIKITLVCSILLDTKNCIKNYLVASITDLLKLKRHSGITPNVKQNCDATSRFLTKQTIQHLAESVPGSSTTQLYFIVAAVTTHEPYRNKNFGPT